MTTADVRDMLDLPSQGQPRPAKKPKLVEKRPEGISREVYSLLGERAAPVAISTVVPYRERPKLAQKAHPWKWTSFTNPARSDGLVLGHWRKKRDVQTGEPADINAATDETTTPALDDPGQQTAASSEPADYYYAKFNAQIQVPEYSDEEYERHLKDKDWTRDETDYLMGLCAQYDLRWIVIADRYQYPPGHDGTTGGVDGGGGNNHTSPTRTRSMEEMKARYYAIAAKTMTLRQTLSSMSSAELDTYEKMTAFDPQMEMLRKRMAEALLLRSPDEIREEEVLLTELKRIVSTQDRLLEERKELYARLDAPSSTGSITAHQSSQGLNQLLQTLLNADKGKNKRRSLAAGPGDNNNAGGASGPPTGTGNATKASDGGGGGGHRDSLGSITGGGTPSGNTNKKGNQAATAAHHQPRRQLTAREEEIYGVTHHERLTSGVQFRHERLNRLAQGKSNVQTVRLANALTELGIPTRLVMPTARVCAEYERLIQSIQSLLDIRKVSEKVEGELKVLQAQREERHRRESISSTGGMGPGPSRPPTAGSASVTSNQLQQQQQEQQQQRRDEQQEQQRLQRQLTVSTTDAIVDAAPTAGNEDVEMKEESPSTGNVVGGDHRGMAVDGMSVAAATATATAPPSYVPPPITPGLNHKRSASVLSSSGGIGGGGASDATNTGGNGEGRDRGSPNKRIKKTI